MSLYFSRAPRPAAISAVLLILAGAVGPVRSQPVTSGPVTLAVPDSVTTPGSRSLEQRADDTTATLDASTTGTTVSVLRSATVRTPRPLSPEEQARQDRLQAAMVSDDYRETSSPGRYYDDLVVSVSQVRFPEGRRLADPNAYRFVSTTETLRGPLGHQPRGSMTGKIVFCSAGHGWTNDNTSTSLWYTQRPELFGIVEDFGNLDQMNLYADFCFRAGATVVPMRPLGYQRIERIVDNDSPHHVQYQGVWHDSQSTIAFTLWNEEVPYRYAVASLTETAVARFRPTLPKSDYYPVYAWARAGADRVNQTYRVVHSGGATEVKVDHRRVGNGWVYLGEYYFERGNDGYVEVTNMVEDPAEADGQHVVIADAVRFGNGMGDVNRGGGISGRPREEEASRYWVERQLARGVEPIYESFDGTDQGTNVSTPPRHTAHMNRETEGTFSERVFLSFHTNAVGGRGVMGLFCIDPSRRTDRQVEWAELVARETNAEMLSGRTPLPVPWSVHPKPAFGHINFGEIRRDAINNEMVATIAEMAYHDNPLDAMLLRIPAVRLAMARAAFVATLKYFHKYAPDQPPVLLPPGAPEILSVTTDATSGVVVAWAPPASDGITSAPVAAYRISHSTNGYGFDGGVVVTGATSYRFDDLTTGTPHFFRVTALNAGGESLPSRTLGTFALQNLPRLLLVSGYSTLSEDAVVTQSAPANMGRPLGPEGEFARIVPRLINPKSQAATGGLAAAALRRPFDSATVEGLLAPGFDLARYDAVVMLLGRQSPSAGVIPDDLQTSLSEYVRGGGSLMVSGATFARALDAVTTASTPGSRQFVLETLGLRFGGACEDSAAASGEPGTLLSELKLELKDPTTPEMVHRPNDVITPASGARPLLRYDNPSRDVAAVLVERSAAGGAVASFGFPLEEVLRGEARQAVLDAVLDAFGVEAEPELARAGDSRELRSGAPFRRGPEGQRGRNSRRGRRR